MTEALALAAVQTLTIALGAPLLLAIFDLFDEWFRREDLPAEKAGPRWLGVPLLLLGAVLRLAGSLYAFDWLEAGSLVPTVAGACCAALGPAALRWAWPVGALLLFALPWPWQLDLLITSPLRRVATMPGTWPRLSSSA